MWIPDHGCCDGTGYTYCEYLGEPVVCHGCTECMEYDDDEWDDDDEYEYGDDE